MSPEREMVDLIRSIMYSADDGNENLADEIIDLAEKLAKYDRVEFAPDHNRLVQMVQEIKNNNKNAWKRIEHLNDSE